MSPAAASDAAATTHTFELAEIGVSVDVPEGWIADGSFVLPEGGADPPTGRGFSVWTIGEIYRHPCEAEQDRTPDVEQRVDAVAAAILEQPGLNRDMGDVTLAGYAGRQIQVQVPFDVDISSCADGMFLRWRADQTVQEGGGRYAQGPGQIDRLWILDADGMVLVVGASYYDATSAVDRAELWRIVESIRFD